MGWALAVFFCRRSGGLRHSAAARQGFSDHKPNLHPDAVSAPLPHPRSFEVIAFDLFAAAPGLQGATCANRLLFVILLPFLS